MAAIATTVNVCSTSRIASSNANATLARNTAFCSGGMRPRRCPSLVAARALLTADKADLDISKMTPMGDRLLVRPREAESKTAGGILLPSSGSSMRADAQVGEVVALGSEVDCGVAVGDTVLYSKFSKADVEVPMGEICFVAQKSVLAKLS